jgi:hypothetical protein
LVHDAITPSVFERIVGEREPIVPYLFLLGGQKQQSNLKIINLVKVIFYWIDLGELPGVF